MQKKTYTFYGNSTLTADIAFISAIGLAREGLKTVYVELGEKNPQVAYQLGIEEQRNKTTDYYILNHKKNLHLKDCVLTPIGIANSYTDNEKMIKKEAGKLPVKLSILIKKTQPEAPEMGEEDWKRLITRIKKEAYEENDVLIFSTNGRMFSFDVFFPVMASDKLILAVEDCPEDLRGLNNYLLELGKINKELVSKAIFLNNGIGIDKQDFDQTGIDIVKSLGYKEIKRIRASGWNCFSDKSPLEDFISYELLERTNEKKNILKVLKKE